jgi:hypothetical protein
MKKFLWVILRAVLAGAMVFWGVSCGKTDQKDLKIKSLESILPEDSEILIKLSSFEKVYACWPVSDNPAVRKHLGRPEDVSKKAGFDPFSIRELQANGFDTAKAFGVAFRDIILSENGKDPLFKMLFFIPVSNGEKAVQSLCAAVQNVWSETRFTRDDPDILFEDPISGARGRVTQTGDYLFIRVDPLPAAGKFPDAAPQGGMADSKNYQEVIAKENASKDVFIYADIQGILKKNLETIKRFSQTSQTAPAPGTLNNLDYLADYEGGAITFDLDSSDLNMNGFVNIHKDSRLLKIIKGIRFNKNSFLGLRENPVLLMSWGVNVHEYYSQLMKTLSENDRERIMRYFEDIRTHMGLDVEKELIPNLGGNFNIGIYDGISIDMTRYNTLMTLSLKDEGAMRNMMEKVCGPGQGQMMSRSEVKGQDVCVANIGGVVQVYAGVNDRNLILSLGNTLYEKALTANAASGFLSNMEDKSLAQALQEDAPVFYLDISELQKAIGNFPFLVSQDGPLQFLDHFQYVLLTTKMEESGMHGSLRVKTRFSEPFFHGVQKLAARMQ